jgi:hypothetical protein
MALKLKDTLKPLAVDKAVRRLSVVSVLFNLAAWAILVIRLFPFMRSGRPIDLHYNVYLNVDNVGPAPYALAGALVGAVIIIVNFWLAARSYGSNRQNTLVILAVTAFYEFLILLAAFFIILINTQR